MSDDAACVEVVVFQHFLIDGPLNADVCDRHMTTLV